MAKRSKQDITASKITLGGVRTFTVAHSGGFDYCQRSATVYRHTEHQAELRMSGGHLSQMHEHLMYLERVGLNPKQFYKSYPAAPRSPLWGAALYKWVGEQVGWSATDTELALETASDILMYSA